ncbi:iron-siderophore ABC transporter substrate-binding protein [Corynebacterium sp.]|uniref:iron-siderophore ABC transporter substrate-binding protein n=1 Tax=Corynebacterium sp. TaxID=1720 RepID=UPI0026DB54AD|nr:iron-siderophore ABC transporter substrate-binding protein [Corynebacterium sp.]MDO5031188.1 iron-siderophore ABC transporter substrate-binding protein [Corynebacterium sp.]
MLKRQLATACAAALTAAATAFTLAACSPAKEQTGDVAAENLDRAERNSHADTAAFPMTITHALGETTIESAPQRIATVGWANHEVPLALGVVPVGMSKVTWGDDDNNGMLPWTEEKLAELGGEQPVLFDETDGIPFEQIANTAPDVILASYSGLTKEDYETLSKIAPVVAYPDKSWQTSMEDMTRMNAQAMGLSAQGDELLTKLKKQTTQALDSYPDLKGKKVLFTAFGGTSDASKLGFYTTADPRMGFLADNGLGVPEIVQKHSQDAEDFWVEVSAEKPEDFADVDLIVAYSSGNAADDAATLKEMQADPLKSKIPAIAQGKVAFLDNGPLGASANQSPLSIPWGVDKYFGELNATAMS